MLNEVVATFSAIIIGTTSMPADYFYNNGTSNLKIVLANKHQNVDININTLNISLEKERLNLLELLDEFADFKENWNENGAEPFSKHLIDKCKEIINVLPVLPEIFPVANNSIQFEYEKENGGYLKFNVFDNKITMFTLLEDGKPFSDKLLNVDNIIKEVQKFYEGI